MLINIMTRGTPFKLLSGRLLSSQGLALVHFSRLLFSAITNIATMRISGDT